MLQATPLGQTAQDFQASRKTLPGDVLEVSVDCESIGNFEMRERGRNFLQPETTALGDIESAREHFGRVLEDAVHLVVTLDEKLSALKLHPVRVLDGFAGLDAHHDILRVRVFFAEIVAVVGGNEREGQVFF